MPKINNPNKSDSDLFRSLVKGVKPLTHNKIRLNPTTTTTTKYNKLSRQRDLVYLNESKPQSLVSGEEFISYKQIGVPNKVLRNLRKGQYNVQAVLDLHGMNIDEAMTAVDIFLQHCLHEQIRVGLIIHGKGRNTGMPVLKNKLNHWLRDTTVVLAFCSAAANHGNRGAIYVLLKRTTEEEKIT